MLDFFIFLKLFDVVGLAPGLQNSFPLHIRRCRYAISCDDDTDQEKNLILRTLRFNCFTKGKWKISQNAGFGLL